MLSVSEKYIRNLNADAQPKLFGQDWNDEAWAVCKSDMLIKVQDAENIILGDTFTKDGFDRTYDGNKWTFDYMLANPPFGVERKQQQRYIEQERDTGFSGGSSELDHKTPEQFAALILERLARNEDKPKVSTCT